MARAPNLLAGGYTVVPGDGTAHFGLVLNVDNPAACTAGYGGTHRIGPDQTKNLPPVNTGARCTLPRGSASTVRGAQNAPAASSGAGSSYPMSYDGMPVPLGNAALTQGSDLPNVAAPLPPAGAGGVDTWLWMMQSAAR